MQRVVNFGMVILSFWTEKTSISINPNIFFQPWGVKMHLVCVSTAPWNVRDELPHSPCHTIPCPMTSSVSNLFNFWPSPTPLSCNASLNPLLFFIALPSPWIPFTHFKREEISFSTMTSSVLCSTLLPVSPNSASLPQPLHVLSGSSMVSFSTLSIKLSPPLHCIHSPTLFWQMICTVIQGETSTKSRTTQLKMGKGKGKWRRRWKLLEDEKWKQSLSLGCFMTGCLLGS